MECFCGSGRGLRRVWLEYLFLRIRAKTAWRGENERVLRDRAVYRYVVIVGYFPRSSALHVFHCVRLDDDRGVAVCKRSSAVQIERIYKKDFLKRRSL